MKPDCYKIMSIAIEEGVLLGLNRAEGNGLIDKQSSQLVSTMTEALMLCVCDYFNFDNLTQDQ